MRLLMLVFALAVPALGQQGKPSLSAVPGGGLCEAAAKESLFAPQPENQAAQQCGIYYHCIINPQIWYCCGDDPEFCWGSCMTHCSNYCAGFLDPPN